MVVGVLRVSISMVIAIDSEAKRCCVTEIEMRFRSVVID